jgi:prepilin-type N-terminal cleavage/methylation domain-containing protein
VKPDLRRYAGSQGGYTLVELIVASAIGVLVMTGLTSVVLSSSRAGAVATSRIEASAQLRSFESFAHDDFARSAAPNAGSCTQPAPSSSAIVLTGTQVVSTGPETGYTVSYTWDGSNFLDRQVADTGASLHAATNVTRFSWYVDCNAAYVVSLTVQVQQYRLSQTFLFYPQVHP